MSITAAGTSKTAQICFNGYIYETLKINFEKQEIVSRDKNPDYVMPTTAPTTAPTQAPEGTDPNAEPSTAPTE